MKLLIKMMTELHIYQLDSLLNVLFCQLKCSTNCKTWHGHWSIQLMCSVHASSCNNIIHHVTTSSREETTRIVNGFAAVSHQNKYLITVF